MPRLISVNVGLPRDVEWRGRIVRTGIWKTPVSGRCRVGKLNLDEDGQGDLKGHGGEQRAVFVYQMDSYRYWQERLGRSDFVHGQFGENFTVEGLPDDVVCIGNRYRIGTALFEVTQPRTTCYRVGLRMNEPRMAALLTSSGRPGFYFRVLEEGAVGADDEIVLVSRGPEDMTVAVVNDLLYSNRHPHGLLELALNIPAMSPGWRRSFEALLQSQDSHPDATGNAGLTGASNAPAPKGGFRQLEVAQIDRECADVRSYILLATDGLPLTRPLPGQFIVVRMRRSPDEPQLYRSYSLSGTPSATHYRISVKLESSGAAGQFLFGHVGVGDILDISEPRGSFTLRPGTGSVVLLSAGIGATPLLAMLHELAATESKRQVWWLHGTRDGRSHSFAAETRLLLEMLTNGRSEVRYSHPAEKDQKGRDYDAPGRIDLQALGELGVPRTADFYICGPSRFMVDMKEGLASWNIAVDHIHEESFAGGPSLMPGVVSASSSPPHQPPGEAGTGALVAFSRSGITTRWHSTEASILELAEACDVPVRWSCRSGVCHNCESGLISGTVSYDPEPLDPPAAGNILICCARPSGDVVIDL